MNSLQLFAGSKGPSFNRNNLLQQVSHSAYHPDLQELRPGLELDLIGLDHGPLTSESHSPINRRSF